MNGVDFQENELNFCFADVNDRCGEMNARVGTRREKFNKRV